MPSLAETQARFAHALIDPGVADVDAMVAGDGLTPAARLAIHRHHHVTSLTAALQTTFPVVHRLVGDGFFRYVAHEFISVHPPVRPCLFEYGEALAGFLETFPACAGVPYLPDVARLEWAVNRAVHADDAVPLDFGRLRSLDPADLDGLTLRFEPSVALLGSPWPVDAIWRANQPAADGVVDLGAGAVRLEIRRLGDDVVFRALPPGTFAFRAALAAGRALEDAVERALDAEPSFDLASEIRALLDERVLAA